MSTTDPTDPTGYSPDPPSTPAVGTADAAVLKPARALVAQLLADAYDRQLLTEAQHDEAMAYVDNEDPNAPEPEAWAAAMQAVQALGAGHVATTVREVANRTGLDRFDLVADVSEDYGVPSDPGAIVATPEPAPAVEARPMGQPVGEGSEVDGGALAVAMAEAAGVLPPAVADTRPTDPTQAPGLGRFVRYHSAAVATPPSGSVALIVHVWGEQSPTPGMVNLCVFASDGSTYRATSVRQGHPDDDGQDGAYWVWPAR